MHITSITLLPVDADEKEGQAVNAAHQSIAYNLLFYGTDMFNRKKKRERQCQDRGGGEGELNFHGPLNLSAFCS